MAVVTRVAVGSVWSVLFGLGLVGGALLRLVAQFPVGWGARESWKFATAGALAAMAGLYLEARQKQ